MSRVCKRLGFVVTALLRVQYSDLYTDTLYTKHFILYIVHYILYSMHYNILTIAKDYKFEIYNAKLRHPNDVKYFEKQEGQILRVLHPS